MRFFPGTTRRRLAAVTAVCTVAVGALTVPLAQADPLKDKQRDVRSQISSAHDDLHESSARAQRTAAALEAAQQRLNAARAELAAARARLTAARIRDREMQRRLALAEQRLERARLELTLGRAAVDQQRADVASMISSIYQQGDPELLAFTAILESETPADLTRQMEARNVAVGNETRMYDDLRATEVLLGVREDEVQDAKQETADRRREAAAHLATMQAAEQDAADAETAVRSSVVESRRARSAARAARAADLRQLRQLEREKDRIEQMLAARAHGSSPTGPSGGFMSFPANGPVTSPFGYRVHPIYGYWGLHDGTDFGAACGSPLYAAADGRVLSSYWSDVYGNRLILDYGVVRGVGLASIYNHATHYTVGVGQRVRRGQVIGYVGTTGWSTGCHLHFTVMVNGKAVNPMNWL